MRIICIFLTGALTAILIWMIGFYLMLGTPTDKTFGLASTYEQKLKKAKEIPSPRLILAGGSGVLMGIAADKLHERLGIPIVNAGLFAGFDTEYQFHLLSSFPKKGDVVLLAYEYSAYTATTIMSMASRNFVIEREPEYFLARPWWEQIAQIASLSPAQLGGWITQFSFTNIHAERQYPLGGLNVWGDQTINRIPKTDTSKRAILNAYKPLPLDTLCEALEDSAEQWTEYLATLKARGVTVIATWPNTMDFPKYHHHASREGFDCVRKLFADNGVKLLGEPEAAMYPKEYFFDTNYHLNADGIEKRAESLAALLAELPEIQKMRAHWKKKIK